MPIAYRNSWRVVKVSMRNAVIGIMMPLVSMNPVVSHCTVLLGTSNSCINVGSVEIISVWLRMATNEPIIRVMTMAVVLAWVVLLELAGAMEPASAVAGEELRDVNYQVSFPWLSCLSWLAHTICALTAFENHCND